MSRSSVEHTRFSKKVAVWTLVASLVAGAGMGVFTAAFADVDDKDKPLYNGLNMGETTDQNPLTKEDFEFIKNTKETVKAKSLESIPSWLNTSGEKYEQNRAQAKAFYDELKESNSVMKKLTDQEKAFSNYSKQPLVMFVSRSMGEEGLRNAFDLASKNQNILVVFRGIPEDAKLGEAILEIQNMAVTYNPMPNIEINPVLFKEYKIHQVPTIMVRSEEAPDIGKLQDEVARVAGLYDPTWLVDRIEAGQKGDLGVRGEVAEISEPDLIEVIKSRVAQIDWEEKKAKTINSFWDRQNFEYLPRATEERIRSIDPRVYVSKDMKTPDGKIIAKAGDVINPLEMMSFGQALIIFDATDEEQLERVEAALPEIKKVQGVQKLVYIASAFRKSEGWSGYEDINDRFDAHVFLLTKEIKERFHIEKLPSVVTEQQGVFIVHEISGKTETEKVEK